MRTINEDLNSRLKAIDDLPFSKKSKHRGKLDATSANILQDDLGQFSDSIKFDYHLDDTTRDRLIAHARQDAAMAYLMATDVYDQAKAANNYAKLAAVFAFLTMCAMVFIVTTAA